MRRCSVCFIRLAAVVVFFCLTACGPLLGAKRADKLFYVLTDDQSVPKTSLASINAGLLVRDTRADNFIDSHKIIFSESSSTRGYYQLAHWVDSPSDRFTSLLIERLRRMSVFRSVTSLSSSAIGELQLNTEIIEFFHDISSSPGSVVVELRAELIDLESREVLGSKTFHKRVEVESYSSEGAVLAFSKATNEILDNLVLWVVQVSQSRKF